MQRILHIVGKMDRAGAETMLMNLYRNIDRSKFQFDFIVFSTAKGDYDEEILALGGRIFPIIAQNPLLRFFRLRSFLIKNRSYKIIHAHMLFSNAFHITAARSAGVKHRISHSHNTSNATKGKILDVIYQNFARELIRLNSTCFIACGNAAGNFLFGKNTDVLNLPNSVDTEYWAKIGIEAKNYIEDKFNFEGLKILQVGRLEPVKNHMFTIQMAEYLQNKGVSFKVFIVGKGSLEKVLKKEVKDRNLEGVVLFLGMRTDIPQLMGGADVLLMPSFHEGFPVVLVESQAAGLPAIISSNISAEVDLGLGLVTSISPNATYHDWASALYNINEKTASLAQNRVEHLSALGFDIRQNAEKLMGVYLNMN